MKIEICASSVEALLGAVALKADRVELCSNLEQGGLTPSSGFIRMAMNLGLNTQVLIRPRPGGFVYNQDEIALIFNEVEWLSNMGVEGIVVGLITEDLRLHRKVIQEIRARFTKEITIHRAFDDLVEWRPELDWLMDIGINRVLSSGLATSAAKGIPTLSEMVARSGGNIEIMAGGGINLANAEEIMLKVKPAAVHFSATSKVSVDPTSLFSENRLMFDANKAKKLVDLCRNFSQ
jgi:copper homeostasis protein